MTDKKLNELLEAVKQVATETSYLLRLGADKIMFTLNSKHRRDKMKRIVAIVMAGVVGVSVVHAESFKLKYDKTGKEHGPFECKEGVKVQISKTSFTIVEVQTDSSTLPKAEHPNPKAASKGGLAGKFNGKQWTGKYAYLNMFNDDKDEHYSVEICAEKEDDKYKRMSLQKLDINLPKKPGVYTFSPTFNTTFYTPPGTNVIGMKGSMTVEKKGDVFTVKLNVSTDDDNNLSGTFTFNPKDSK